MKREKGVEIVTEPKLRRVLSIVMANSEHFDLHQLKRAEHMLRVLSLLIIDPTLDDIIIAELRKIQMLTERAFDARHVLGGNS